MSEVQIKYKGATYTLLAASGEWTCSKHVPVPLEKLAEIIEKNRLKILIGIFLDDCLVTPQVDVGLKLGIPLSSVKTFRHSWGTKGRKPSHKYRKMLNDVYGKKLIKG